MLKINHYLMQATLWVACFFFTIQHTFAQVTIRVTQAPEKYTPLLDNLYFASNINNWAPGNSAFKLSKADGVWSITVNPQAANFEYKITRGTWPTVEVAANGQSIANRVGTNTPGSTINITIPDWEDTRGNHTSNQLVNILASQFFMPQLGKLRRIWICLPETYNTQPNKRYPVLYMHDGQNLFDGAFAPFGEWRVDENMLTLGRTLPQLETIVVGIDHGGSDRINELSPYVNSQYGGGQGGNYARFMVETLKPFIDSMFRTLPQREFTGIGGSSMGGLMALYAGSRYAATFGKWMVFSPAFWFSSQLYNDVAQFGYQPGTKVHFVAGQNESATMVSNMRQMETTLLNAGFPRTDVKLDAFADGAHSEWFWAREFTASWRWLMENTVTSTLPWHAAHLHATYIPAIASIQLHGFSENQLIQYQLSDQQGKMLKSGSFTQQLKLSSAGLPSGIYHVRLSQGSQYRVQKVIIY
jgi:metallo-beta-lactamase class B